MNLISHALQSRQPGYSEETVNLDMDGQSYRAVKHVVTAPNATGKEPVYISAANGFNEDPEIWQPLASRLARIACKAGQQMVLVTYEDSPPNGVDDILSFRAEQLAHVIRSTRSDGRLVMSGHSRGWISTALAASEQQDEVDRLVGFGVAGLAPRPSDSINILKIGEITSRVAISEFVTHSGPFDIWGKLSISPRFMYNSLAYLANNVPDMYREGSQILAANVIAQTVALSEHAPTTIWVHGRDGFFNPTLIRENLTNAGYQGEIRDVPTSHLGPIMDLSLARDLYTDLTGTQLERVA